MKESYGEVGAIAKIRSLCVAWSASCWLLSFPLALTILTFYPWFLPHPVTVCALGWVCTAVVRMKPRASHARGALYH